jgi:hypothetical protein
VQHIRIVSAEQRGALAAALEELAATADHAQELERRAAAAAMDTDRRVMPACCDGFVC